MAEENILFQDIFDIKDVDPNGKRFDRGMLYIDCKQTVCKRDS
jgi:hypothetical protein